MQRDNALLAAETERTFADDGHSLDFINKAFECLDLIGWEYASSVLPAVVGQMVAARGARNRPSGASLSILSRFATKRPGNFRSFLRQTAARQLVGPRGAGRGGCWAMIRRGSSPQSRRQSSDGAVLIDLGRSLAYSAALRVARFGNANEHADWETAHHVFTYANALCRILGRIGIAIIDHLAAARGLLHGPMALYLTRYLNVPPARIPGEGGERLDDLPADEEAIRNALLDAFDRQRQVDLAARLVARHLPAHPHCDRPLSRRPFADRARGAADGRHRRPLDAGRRAASGSSVVRPADNCDAALVDGENFDLVVGRQDNITCGSADQSPRDGGDVRN